MIFARNQGQPIIGLNQQGLENYIEEISIKDATSYYSNGRTNYCSNGDRIHIKEFGNGLSGKCISRQIFYCNRNGEDKLVGNPERVAKVSSCKLGANSCCSRFVAWTYEDHDELEVYYVSKHDHSIGGENVRFARLSKRMKENLRTWFMDGYTIKKIRELMIASGRGLRDRNISERDIRAIQVEVEKADFCFHAADEFSVEEWVNRLDKTNELMYHQSQEEGSFELAFITKIGRHSIPTCRGLLCLDSTHKTTSYGYNLFTIVAQNEFGHGVPIAHLISSNGTEETLIRFLSAFKKICPRVSAIMTDNDNAEINAIEKVFPDVKHLLCWWHIIQNWKKKLLMIENKPSIDKEKFYGMMLGLLMNDYSPNEFETRYQEILSLSSASFGYYLNTWYLKKKEKWAYCYRKSTLMFKETNSNMLIESFHNILKTKFFSGKINRRMDRLIYVLTGSVQMHYADTNVRNFYGFNGQSSRRRVLASETDAARLIPDDSITKINDCIYKVSNEFGDPFEVDIAEVSCSCHYFLLYQFCKHLFKIKPCFDESWCFDNEPFPDEESPAYMSLTSDVLNSVDDSSEDEASDYEEVKEIIENDRTARAMVVKLVKKYIKSFKKPEKIPPNIKSATSSIHPFKKAKPRGRPAAKITRKKSAKK